MCGNLRGWDHDATFLWQAQVHPPNLLCLAVLRLMLLLGISQSIHHCRFIAGLHLQQGIQCQPGSGHIAELLLLLLMRACLAMLLAARLAAACLHGLRHQGGRLEWRLAALLAAL